MAFSPTEHLPLGDELDRIKEFRALKALDRCIDHWSTRDERRRREQREAQLYI